VAPAFTRRLSNRPADGTSSLVWARVGLTGRFVEKPDRDFLSEFSQFGLDVHPMFGLRSLVAKAIKELLMKKFTYQLLAGATMASESWCGRAVHVTDLRSNDRVLDRRHAG
jgi:hypothetical protein